MLDFFFFSSRRRHTRCLSDWSSDVCSSDLFSDVWPDGPHRFHTTEVAAQSVGVRLGPVEIRDVLDVNDIMAAVKKAGATTLVVQPSPFKIGRASCRERV